MSFLTVNAGSSSLKLALCDAGGRVETRGAVTEIGGGAARLETAGGAEPVAAPDHRAAFAALLPALDLPTGLTAAVHRVVHGGQALTRPVPVTAAVRDGIAACIPLAPLHNPAALSAIDALTPLRPDLTQIACFDTAFHATNPESAWRYALPAGPETAGIRRYGFHGLSYAGLVAGWPDLTATPLPGRLLAFHLGNGASVCAIRDGRSVATSMGYSPVSGLTMGSRVGEIDANAVLDLADRLGIDGARRLLNAESGLKGLGGASDMRALRAAGQTGAVDHFCYWAARAAGSLAAAMGGCDGVVFTGGIGENDAAARADIAARLGHLGVALDPAANAAGGPALAAANATAVPAWVLPAQEETQLVREARAALSA
ncbi:MAG: acetate kinase [Pseudomonadota bacterium]